MQKSGPCLCLPKWIYEPIKYEVCCYCKKRIYDGYYCGGSLFIPCVNTPTEVHILPINLHSKCTQGWQSAFKRGVRYLLCDFIPFSAQTLQEDPIILKQATDMCLKDHVFTQDNCAWCGARSQEKVPFTLECDACKRVKYCEEACKKDHEKKHKVICELL